MRDSIEEKVESIGSLNISPSQTSTSPENKRVWVRISYEIVEGIVSA
jgi:hypothetical protein